MRARSPPESIASACGFLPGGRATISMPVAVRSPGSVSESRAKPPPKSCWNRVSNADSSWAKVVRKRVAMSSSSSAMSVRVLAIASFRSAAWPSRVVEPLPQRCVLLDGEGVGRAQLVVSAAERREATRRRRLDGGSRPGPHRGHRGEGAFQAGRVVVDGVFGPSVVAASGPGSTSVPPAAATRWRTPSSPRPASSTSVCSRSDSRPSRASRSRDLDGSQPVLGRPQPLPGAGRRALGFAEPGAIAGVGREQRLQLRRGMAFPVRGRRERQREIRALALARRLPLRDGRELGGRRRDPSLVHRDRRLGTRAPTLGLPARCFLLRVVRRQPVASRIAAPQRAPPRWRSPNDPRPPRLPRRRRHRDRPDPRPRTGRARRRSPVARPAPPATPPRGPRPPGRARPSVPRLGRLAFRLGARLRVACLIERDRASAAARPAGSAASVAAFASVASRSRSRVSRSASARRSSRPSPRPRRTVRASTTADPSRTTTRQPAGSSGWTASASSRVGTQPTAASKDFTTHRGPGGRRPPARRRRLPRRRRAQRRSAAASRRSRPLRDHDGARARPASAATLAARQHVRAGELSQRRLDRRAQRRVDDQLLVHAAATELAGRPRDPARSSSSSRASAPSSRPQRRRSASPPRRLAREAAWRRPRPPPAARRAARGRPTRAAPRAVAGRGSARALGQ